jgi:hypothetical protein
MEQLGETLELEGADGPAAQLELSEPVGTGSASTADGSDDLELALPGKEFHGGYDSSLSPPETARADLERIRLEHERVAAAAAPPPAVTFSAPPSGPLSGPPSVPVSGPAETRATAAGPVVIGRPVPPSAVHVAEMVAGKPGRTPATFLELLDQSLSL